MDLMMPVKSGFDAARELRTLNTSDSATIPIIALSADVTSDIGQRCSDAGINYVVCKPIDQSVLFSNLAEGFQRQAESENMEG